jgi:hypothetical protein
LQHGTVDAQVCQPEGAMRVIEIIAIVVAATAAYVIIASKGNAQSVGEALVLSLPEVEAIDCVVDVASLAETQDVIREVAPTS